MLAATATASSAGGQAPQCAFCKTAITPQMINRCPFGHAYCDDCSIVISVDPDELLPNEFHNFCPQCKANSLANNERPEPQPPNAFFCPINHTVMRDPVVIQDGMSYERTAIEGWLANKTTSPLTSAYVDQRIIIANVNLRKVIELWLEGHGKTHDDFS